MHLRLKTSKIQGFCLKCNFNGCEGWRHGSWRILTGVAEPRTFLGPFLISEKMSSDLVSVTSSKPVPFGKLRRSRPLKYSAVHRCQAEYGSKKGRNTETLANQ